jgi:hypothetical protein
MTPAARPSDPPPAGVRSPRSLAATALQLSVLIGILACAPGARGEAARGGGAPESWPLLPETFESTGGGGWMITDYRPVVIGAMCRTEFVAVSPDGKDRFPNIVEWTAMARDGGVFCAEGRWRAKDGSASGTTPLQVFIKDGVVRRAP